jgi:phage tail tape-measure protein
MTDDRTIERTTVTDDGDERRETTKTTDAPRTGQIVEKGVPHGDEEAGGAVAGGLGGAAVGAVVGGPVGAVVGGAIGAASGATAGALDDKRKDEEVVVEKSS